MKEPFSGSWRRRLPVSHAADGVADVAGNTRQGHRAPALDAGPFDLARHHACRRVAAFALPCDFMADGLEALVQLSLVDRVLKRQRMDGAGPLLELLRMAAGADREDP